MAKTISVWLSGAAYDAFERTRNHLSHRHGAVLSASAALQYLISHGTRAIEERDGVELLKGQHRAPPPRETQAVQQQYSVVLGGEISSYVLRLKQEWARDQLRVVAWAEVIRVLIHAGLDALDEVDDEVPGAK